MEIAGDGGLFETLIDEFSALPKSPKLADYAVVNVAPSVVPNPFLPAFRVFSYNISDTTHEKTIRNRKKPKKPSKRKHGHNRGDQGNKTEHCRSEEYQDTWRCHLDQPWTTDPDSPSRRNQRFTPLGYAQVSHSYCVAKQSILTGTVRGSLVLCPETRASKQDGRTAV